MENCKIEFVEIGTKPRVAALRVAKIVNNDYIVDDLYNSATARNISNRAVYEDKEFLVCIVTIGDAFNHTPEIIRYFEVIRKP